MSAGSYSATITISAPGATNTPQTIPVSLTIDPQPSCWSRGPLSNGELADLVVRHFPDGVVPQTGENIRVTAYAVARAESDGNPTACGDAGQSIGIWQVNMPYHPEYSIECLFDPDCNAEAAVEISNNGLDWNPWCTWETSACGGDGNEAYKAYLDEAKAALGTAPTPTEDRFQYPAEGYAVNGYYFGQSVPTDDYPQRYHLAEDVIKPAGTTVYACADGVVKLANNVHTGAGNYGGLIIVEHTLANGEKVCSLYGHLDDSKTLVRPDSPTANVECGQPIGELGSQDPNINGGNIPHLHFGIRHGAFPGESASDPYTTNGWYWAGYGTRDPRTTTNWWVKPSTFIRDRAASWDEVGAHSPVEIRIYDSQEHVTGIVNGEARADIPDSCYCDNTVTILYPSDLYQYEVVGTGEGSYALTVTQVREETREFTVTNMATSTGAVHEYTIDWDALSQGEDGVTVYVDSDGDGIVDKILKMGGSFNLGCFIATAAYGTPMAREIGILREFRDEYLLTNSVGQALVGLYYRTSPPIAEFITEHPVLKPIVRAGLLPAVVMSTVIVDTSPTEKTAVIGLVAVVSAALAVWATRRRSRGMDSAWR
jgi:hypothetical protein